MQFPVYIHHSFDLIKRFLSDKKYYKEKKIGKLNDLSYKNNTNHSWLRKYGTMFYTSLE